MALQLSFPKVFLKYLFHVTVLKEKEAFYCNKKENHWCLNKHHMYVLTLS